MNLASLFLLVITPEVNTVARLMLIYRVSLQSFYIGCNFEFIIRCASFSEPLRDGPQPLSLGCKLDS